MPSMPRPGAEESIRALRKMLSASPPPAAEYGAAMEMPGHELMLESVAPEFPRRDDPDDESSWSLHSPAPAQPQYRSRVGAYRGRG